MKPKLVFNAALFSILFAFACSEWALAYTTYIDGSQIRRCRTLDEIVDGPVIDPFRYCPLVEATDPPAASLSDVTITTELDFWSPYDDVLERWTIPGREPIERFYEWGVNGYSQWYGPCANGRGFCYFNVGTVVFREFYEFSRTPLSTENLGTWKYEEFVGAEIFDEMAFEMKGLVLTEESTVSRIGIVNQDIQSPFRFRLATFEDTPEKPHPVAGESVTGTLTGPKRAKGAAVYGLGSGSKTDANGIDSATIHLGSKPGIYTLRLANRWVVDQPTFDFFAIDDIEDLDPEQEHPDTEEGVGEEEGKACGRVGNPVSLAIGNKFQREVDIQQSGISPIEFIRYHNSLGFVSASFNNYWTHTYDRHVEIPANPAVNPVKVIRPDGRKINFSWNGSRYQASAGIYATLEQAAGGWRFTGADMTVELFDIDGFLTEIRNLNGLVQTASYDKSDRLVRIESNLGESLGFAYDSSGRLSAVTDQTGRSWGYSYEVLGRLHSVEKPDGTSRIYHYEDLRHPYSLTGITDENGVRFATYEYDEAGMAVASYHANDADRVDIQYGENGERIVLDPLGNATVYQTRIENKRGVLDGISGPVCSQGCGLSDTQFVYDAESNITSRTSFGVTTEFGGHDSKGQPGFRIQAVGTPDQRRIDYEYDPRFRNKVTRMTEPSVFSGGYKVTERTYNEAGEVISETVSGFDPQGQPMSRTTANTYNGPFGQVTSHDGPGTDGDDIIRYEYYSDTTAEGFNRGRLKSVTDANGTRARDNIQYSETGKIQSESQPNGVAVNYAYYPGNDRVESMTVSGGGMFNRTRWEYTPAGDVSMIILDDETGQEVITRMFYDGARRLYKTESRVSRTVNPSGYVYNAEQWETYQFDGAGNITSETHVSTDLPGEDIVIQRVFDEYSRIDKLSNGGVTEDYNFNPNGTLASKIDGKSNLTTYTYDDFKRLTRTEQVGQVITLISYDVHGNTTRVTDPEGHSTRYLYDDLGNLVQQDSPDTGITVHAYNRSGQLTRSVDAKGQSSVYAYDVSGRLMSIDREGSDYDISYSYDQCANGLGRLCSISTGWGHSIQYSWNALGEKTSVVTNEGEISYTYGLQGSIESIVYPSGREVEFHNDGGGLASSITLVAQGLPEIKLVDEIKYSPFRRPVSWRLGNGKVTNIDLDTRHRPVSIDVPGAWNWEISEFDAVDNPLVINSSFASTSFTYDALDRLTGASSADTETSFEYDKVGNRTALWVNGDVESGAYQLSSNRILSFGVAQYSLDANGNTVAVMESQDSGKTFAYSSHNRLVDVTDSKTSSVLGAYQYDGLGQRVTATTSSGTRKFLYGPSGELLAEMDGSGKVLHEYVYLNGILIADLYELPTEAPPGIDQEIIVDSDGSSVDVTGSRWSTKSNPAAVNGTYLQNRKYSGRTVRWYVDEGDFQAGRYDVYVKWLKSPNNGVQTWYRLLRLDDQVNGYWTSVRIVHSGLNVGDWALLGNYEFNAPPAGVRYQGVYLMGDDNTGGLAGSYLAADAVKLVPATDPRTLANLRYIHTDHLGAPHVVTDGDGEIVWTAEYQPFGKATVNEDPDGDLESYELNIRLPGQYYNEESGLHYNYFRDYDPGTGRYIESDPIGLDGGLNTFSYALNRPGRFVDPLGLVVSGVWLKEPKVNFTSYGLTGISPISPYVDEWGYLKTIAVSGYAAGFVNLDVRCSDSACASQDWEIHERIEFSFSGSKDVGPNVVAAAAGGLAGPLAGAATGILTFGGASLAALLGLLQEAEALGADKVQWLYGVGPDVICRGFH